MSMRYESEELSKAIRSGCKYFALIVGAGEGCDYTMGCNIAFHPLSGDTFEEASKGAEKHLGYDEYKVETVLVIEASKLHFLDVLTYYRDAKRQEAEDKQRAVEESEKAEYERLKSKFSYRKTSEDAELFSRRGE